MSATNTVEAGILSLMFENAAFTGVGDAGGLLPSAGAGNFYISLHTADPGEAGAQNTTEASYAGYSATRPNVARSTAGWTVSGTAPTQVSNDAAINFGQCTSGSQTITHVGIGNASSGAGVLYFKGTASLAVSTNITPSFGIGALIVTLD